jgi:hypothetical protein
LEVFAMFGQVIDSRRKTRWADRHRVRPRLERLESRACRSGGGPTITSFTAFTEPGHIVELRGTVTDNDPASVLLTFSGAATGYTTADSAGHFDFFSANASLGTATAVAVDGQNLSSPPASANITDPAPVLTLSISYGRHTTVTLSGSVTDVDLVGLTVTLTGKVNASAVTDANGNFSVTTQATGLGPVTASTTDLWGVASNQPYVNVYDTPPQITSFSARESPGNLWTFYGTVAYRDPDGLVVNLSGFPSLSGQGATVGDDGKFCTVVQMSPTDNGQVRAVTTDWYGLASDVDFVNITQ